MHSLLSAFQCIVLSPFCMFRIYAMMLEMKYFCAELVQQNVSQSDSASAQIRHKEKYFDCWSYYVGRRPQHTSSKKWQPDLIKSLNTKYCLHLSSCRQLCTILTCIQHTNIWHLLSLFTYSDQIFVWKYFVTDTTIKQCAELWIKVKLQLSYTESTVLRWAFSHHTGWISYCQLTITTLTVKTIYNVSQKTSNFAVVTLLCVH